MNDISTVIQRLKTIRIITIVVHLQFTVVFVQN